MRKDPNQAQVGSRLELCLYRWLCTLLFLLAVLHQPATAKTTDWGVIAVDRESTYFVSGIDITNNFTDQYTFSIAGGSNAAYAVNIFVDLCLHGCGKPDVSYGIYNLNGSLISGTGSAVLSAGEYVFAVNASGMGAGNSVSYNGTVSFSPATFFEVAYPPATFVSAAPEPRDLLLFISGGVCLILLVRRRRGVMGRDPVAPFSEGWLAQ